MFKFLLKDSGISSYLLRLLPFFFLLLIQSQSLHLIYPTAFNGGSRWHNTQSKIKILNRLKPIRLFHSAGFMI
jgi:hypothetical protein